MPTDEQRRHLLWEGKHLACVARGTWEYVTRRGSSGVVGIVAITPDRRVILVEQFRPAVGCRVIELPAGLVGDRDAVKDESLVSAARRELLEETGYMAGDCRELVRGFSSPGLTDEAITLFLATGLQKQGPGGGEGSEEITVHEIPMDQISAWINQQHQRGVLADLKLLAGLFAARDLVP